MLRLLSASAAILSLFLLAAPQDAPPQLGTDLTSRFDVAPGLAVTLWADTPQLYNPAAFDIDARGRVWVAEAVNYRRWEGRNPGYERTGGDRIVILEDTDGDGVCDSSKVFVQEEDLVSPLGILVLGNQVLVSCSPRVLRYTDDDGDDVPDRREVLLEGFGGFDHDHGAHSWTPGPDGRLYMALGNAGPHVVTDRAGWTLRSGSVYDGGGPKLAGNRAGLVSDDGRAWVGGLVLRMNRDGTGLTVLAHNFRNDYEVAVDSFGDLFVSDNDDDGNQGCRLAWVMEGGNYGYLSADGTRFWGADRRPGQSTWTAHWHQDDPGVVPPGARTGAGGPTGVAVYEGSLLPGLAGAVLEADAGANRVFLHRPKPQGAGIVFDTSTFLGAKKLDGDDRWHWYRPSDVAVAPDGSVFVADWWDPGVGGHLAGDRECRGRIFRVAPAGHRPATPRMDLATPEGRRAALASPAVSVRDLAAEAFVARGEASIEELEPLLGSDDARLRARALFTMSRLGLDGMMAAASTKVRRTAEIVTVLRALRSGGPSLVASVAKSTAAVPLPDVQREVALSLRDVPLAQGSDALVTLAKAVDPADRFALEAFGIACTGREAEVYDLLLPVLGDANPLAWSPRFAALAWRLHPPQAAPALFVRAASPALSPDERRRATDALAFVPTREAAGSMLTLAMGGPDDVRPLAAWWVRHRSTNDWRAFGLAAHLPEARIDRAGRAFASGVVRAGLHEVDVDVSGASALWLVADGAGDGISCDWADWVEPRWVVGGSEVSATATPWLSATAEWGAARVDTNCNGGALRVGGKEFRGIGTHARSEIAYAVPEGATRFRARVGPDDGGIAQNGGRTTSVDFQVWLEREADRSAILALQRTVADASSPRAARAEAAEKLAADAEGGLFLLRLAQKHALADDLRTTVEEAIARNPDLAVRALATSVFPRRAKGGASLPSLDDLAAMPGDASRGRRVFVSKEAACASCHVLDGRGTDVGPDLTAIGAKLGRRELLDAILNPSAGIAHGYDSWLVATKGGRTLTGFLLADGPTLVLKDNQGNRHAIPAELVEERVKQTISAMPEGLALGLDAQSLADLAACLLEDRSTPPRLGEPIVLFDGKSFDGWTHHLSDPKAARDDVWSIRDGVLVCKGKPAGYLRTTRDFRDFVLTLEWRFDPAKGPGNSGVLLRTTGPDKVWPRSIEAQLHHTDAGDIWNIDEVPMLVDPARTQGRRTVKLRPSSEKPLGEWNRYEITLRGGDLRLVVNGVLQNEARWCEEIAGKICLQSEGAEIHFRNVVLREIE